LVPDESVLVDGFLVGIELDVFLDHVDVGTFKESTDFVDVAGTDLVVYVETGHRF
jgi:hypothetical protein